MVADQLVSVETLLQNLPGMCQCIGLNAEKYKCIKYQNTWSAKENVALSIQNIVFRLLLHAFLFIVKMDLQVMVMTLALFMNHNKFLMSYHTYS